MSTPVLGPSSMGKTVVREARKPALHASQGLISGALLLAIRQTELQRGTLLAHHGRHPAALRPTPTRKNGLRSYARRVARSKARYRAAVALHYQHVTGNPAGFERLDGNWYVTAHDEFKHAA